VALPTRGTRPVQSFPSEAMPDRWLVLAVRAPSDERLEALAEGLVALGGSAVQEEGGELTTYLRPPPDLPAFLAAAEARLRGIAGEAPGLRWRWQEDEDWARRWREGLMPRRVGERIIVTQPWSPVDDDAVVVVVIDPATAFGTGEHATTRGALRLMQAVLRGGERVLDVGTGSGILALAAAGLGASAVEAVESDPDAMGNARENLDRSSWGSRIELVNAEVDPAYLARRKGAGYDLIVANVLSGVLTPMLPAFARATRPGGAVVLGGILESEAPAVVDAAGAAGLSLEAEDREEGWWTALFRGAPG
jgi:ribosomal protein L11 methyltransferase